MPRFIVANSNNVAYTIPVREDFSASLAPSGSTSLDLTDVEAEIVAVYLNSIAGVTFIVQQLAVAGVPLSGGARSLVMLARDAKLPASNPAALATIGTSEHEVLDFNDSTQQSVYFARAVPAGYAGEDLVVTVDWHSAAAIIGKALWSVQFQRILVGTTLMSSATFATAKTVFTIVPGVAATPVRSSITFTNSEADVIAAKDYFRIRLARLAADVTDDTLVGNARVSNVEISF